MSSLFPTTNHQVTLGVIFTALFGNLTQRIINYRLNFENKLAGVPDDEILAAVEESDNTYYDELLIETCLIVDAINQFTRKKYPFFTPDILFLRVENVDYTAFRAVIDDHKLGLAESSMPQLYTDGIQRGLIDHDLPYQTFSKDITMVKEWLAYTLLRFGQLTSMKGVSGLGEVYVFSPKLLDELESHYAFKEQFFELLRYMQGMNLKLRVFSGVIMGKKIS